MCSPPFRAAARIRLAKIFSYGIHIPGLSQEFIISAFVDPAIPLATRYASSRWLFASDKYATHAFPSRRDWPAANTRRLFSGDTLPFYIFATPAESILLSIITTISPIVHHLAFAALAAPIENPHAAFAPPIG